MKDKSKEEKQKFSNKEHKSNRSKKSKSFKIILSIIIILFLVSGVIFAHKVIRNGGGLQGFMATAVGHDENTLKELEKLTFLVVGISGCEEDYKLADTIMLCSYDPKTQQASMLSIPRDTYVGKDKNKAKASYKINAVYQNGKNIDGMLENIQELTGIEVKHYVIVDTEALKQLVDAIGGVEFDVPMDMKYDDVTQDLHIDLKAGKQRLNGQQAEWLVRFRHSNDPSETYPAEYGEQDIGRTRTQRKFIQATLKQVLKPENLLKINEITKIAFENVKTNMTFEDIKDYIPYSVNFNTENLKTDVLPGVAEICNKVAIYSINKKQAAEVIQELFNENLKEEKEENNTIEESNK